MRSGQLAQGARVKAFEEAFAAAVGAHHAVATSNGSTALLLALRALGIGAGHEVITSPLTFVATANAIIQAGATPIFADVDDTLNLAPELVERLVGPATRAILPVHLHGNPSDLRALRAIAERHDIALLQDACQAVGAAIDGRPLGEFGTAVYSFYATKNITTGGEGGMVVSNDAAVAAFCARMRHQAYAPGGAYLHDDIGYNFRMTEIQAAIGLCQLRRLNDLTAQRRGNAAYLDQGIDRQRFPRPRVLPGHAHVYHQYVVRVAPGGRDRAQVQEQLAQRGIGSGVHYPVPVHRQPAYRELVHASLPEAEAAAREMLSIPVHPALTHADLDRVVEAFAAL
jgi:dTDP-4-amino-4,6-dideoxygalactose transaminase